MSSTPPDDRSDINPDAAPAALPAGNNESPSQPHDGFFKQLFRDPVHAAAELRAILPEPVLDDLRVTPDDDLLERPVGDLARVAQELLLRQLSRRFGTLPEAVTARVMDAGHEEIDRWGDRILDAASLDDVFAAP